MSSMQMPKVSLAERWSKLWSNFLSAPRRMPSRITILDSHVLDENYSPITVAKDVHYFMVQINELYLSYQSKLWVNLDPTVFIATEFKYSKQKETVPFVVGPSMIANLQQKLPSGMIFSNTKVAGLHPYKGDTLALTVILCQASTGNTAKQVLKMVETASGALDYSTVLSSYLKVADVVVGGVEDLMGLNGITPLIGLRVEFEPDVKHDLKQCYFTLINKPEGTVKAEELWVKNDSLLIGPDPASARPLRDADYVLYSIRGTEERDVDGLPFDSLWVRVQQEAMQPDDSSWDRAKADMLSLFQTMYLSPDLTKQHALKLKAQRETEMKQLHDEVTVPQIAAKLSARGKKPKKKLPEDKEITTDENLKEAVNILKL
jgi:hypothetical protein